MTRPFVPTPFARELLLHIRRWRAMREHGDAEVAVSPFWDTWTDGIHPDFRSLGERAMADDRVRPHAYLCALHSSMAFAFNLFLPFRAGADLAPALLGSVGALEVHDVVFEWTPPGALLGEIDGDEPREDERATGVDVLVRATRPGGARVALLVEVKLSEGGFTGCGGRRSPANRRTDLCDDAEAFFDDPSGCYLTRPVRKLRDRRYWSIFAAASGSVRRAFPGADLAGPCPFAGDAQQLMRQHAIALGLVQEGLAEEAWVVLVHHDDNPEVSAHWERWCRMLPEGARVARVPASVLLETARGQGLEAWASWMSDRYRLEVR
ncbi:MAG: hypothetical protein KC656_20900 [Myxococcales bacterium]|nr:hypothetical protein [Myxococcales bacterium]